MKKKNICIHGHFYQPPRENPWLDKVEIQESAYPYHDWNHRINAECYRRNSASRILDSQGRIEEIINNYSWMSFNMGPTLLAWMQEEAPESYEAILQADKESQEHFSGHGSALAQAFNHLIMPLANERDQETQVIWGIEDFKSRFGRMPEGMWLGETAVSTPTLELLAKHGIKFTILSPYQAKSQRKSGENKWQDATGAKIDPRRPYRCDLPSGNQIALFFYDGPASQGVAFEGLLNNAKKFADRLLGQLQDREEAQLFHIATDGESYGHHHRFGEMALSACLDHIAQHQEIDLSIYGEFLEKYPPKYEAQILENTSWSCSHGVERWKSDCGCNTGGNADWNQKWRAPLREAFDWVREQLIQLYEAQMQEYSSSPWDARNAYIQVVLNRNPENVENFFQEQFREGLTNDDKVKLLKLLEMQYHCMLMYTSCGWFFDEVTGLESMQDIFYATRAIQLAEEISGNQYEEEFKMYLEKIPSNIPELGTALKAYEKYVKPMEIDMTRIGAHYAVSSLFEEFPEEASLYNFSAHMKVRNYYESGKQKLLIGRTEIRSDITWEKVDISYAVLHLGDQHLFSGVKKDFEEQALTELHEKAVEFFEKGNIYEIFNLMDTYFGNHSYSFWHLFRDEQRRIMELVMENTMRSAEGALQLLFENTYPLLKTFNEINMKVPDRLRLPVETAVNTNLVNNLKREKFKVSEFIRLLDTAEFIEVNLDITTLKFLVDQRLTSMFLKLKEHPEDQKLMDNIIKFLDRLNESAISPEKWAAQNIAFDLLEEKYSEMQTQAEGNEEAGKWVEKFTVIAENLNLSHP